MISRRLFQMAVAVLAAAGPVGKALAAQFVLWQLSQRPLFLPFDGSRPTDDELDAMHRPGYELFVVDETGCVIEADECRRRNAVHV